MGASNDDIIRAVERTAYENRVTRPVGGGGGIGIEGAPEAIGLGLGLFGLLVIVAGIWSSIIVGDSFLDVSDAAEWWILVGIVAFWFGGFAFIGMALNRVSKSLGLAWLAACAVFALTPVIMDLSGNWP